MKRSLNHLNCITEYCIIFLFRVYEKGTTLGFLQGNQSMFKSFFHYAVVSIPIITILNTEGISSENSNLSSHPTNVLIDKTESTILHTCSVPSATFFQTTIYPYQKTWNIPIRIEAVSSLVGNRTEKDYETAMQTWCMSRILPTLSRVEQQCDSQLR